ncbi:MAG: polymerase subunit delta [Sphingomonas bacterium]|nr:DNA polymerase III subunit delta' [Sphingomonas bacterium]MDB5690403.1 polymerase subunit delta [Sphingomonas bacterium]
MNPIRGHDGALAAFREAAASGRLHHAWLLAGPEGIGKASFAYALARRLLAEAAGPALGGEGLDVPDDHPIASLLAAGSHPDFKHLQRLPKDGTGDLARNINVGQIRALQGLLGSTPSMSDRRIVLVDSVDDLEPSGANALLKNLEEPPADCLFLLVSHAPGRLLPTIRSRCRMLRLQPLGVEDMRAVLLQTMPDADPAEIDTLAPIANGAPGRAMHFAGLDLGALEDAMSGLLIDGDPSNAARVQLARKLATKPARLRYEAFLARVPGRIAEHARHLEGEALPPAIEAWQRARALAASAPRLTLDPQSVVFELCGLLAALAPRHATAKA